MSLLSRGGEISRLEAFSDAVFGISAALLVVSLELPCDFDGLMANLSGFLAFGLSFTMLLVIWSAHNRFFRQFPLQDPWTVTINGILLFVVLFYVYPLKFLATALVEFYFRMGPYYDPATGPAMLRSGDEMRQLMLLYSFGFIAVFSCFALLYTYAGRCHRSLNLGPLERFDIRQARGQNLIYIAVGILSLILAGARIGDQVGASGWIYAILGPVLTWHGRVGRRRRSALAASLE